MGEAEQAKAELETKFDLGKGRRVIVMSGKLDSKFRIIIPQEFLNAVS